MIEKTILGWRICKAEPSGLLVWFDPELEEVKLFLLEEPRTRSGVPDGPEVDYDASDVDEDQVNHEFEPELPF